MAKPRSSFVSRMLRFVAALIVLAAIFVLANGPSFMWQQFGAADLGQVDFTTLQRRSTPNDALVCRKDICAATADLEPPEFDVPVAELYRLVQAATAHEFRLERVGADEKEGTLRYVQRSRWMGFPDTINVKINPLENGHSIAMLYSRSQLGTGDFGVNRARLERWNALLQATAQARK